MKNKSVILKKLAALLAAAVLALSLSGCSLFGGNTVQSAIGSYDFSEMRLIQLEEPSDGQPLAVIETSMGTIKAVLYPEYAPNTVDNFVNRVNEGYYDGKDVYALVEEALFMSGSYNDEGTQGFTNDGNPIPNEYSVNLWTFRGALCSYSGNAGYGDSRFFFVNNRELTEEELAELRSFKDADGNQKLPEELITAFVEKGSFAHIAGFYTVFGQAIEGLDVIEQICTAERDEKTARPLEEIKINSIKMTEYHKEEEAQ